MKRESDKLKGGSLHEPTAPVSRAIPQGGYFSQSINDARIK